MHCMGTAAPLSPGCEEGDEEHQLRVAQLPPLPRPGLFLADRAPVKWG